MLIDFCGFTFNGIHSSELSIVRVSNGTRYNETLGATFQDKIEPINGGDGTLYWNSYYNNKPFSLQIAYDRLTEAQLRKLRQVFCAKAMGELILDETPYKAYTVKVQSPVQLQYLCFNDVNNDRVYKGEGTIQLIAYYPYAKSVHKYLDEFNDFFYLNKNEWAEASGMARTKGILDGTGGTISVYNPGDVETDWQAFYTMTDAGCALGSITLDEGTTTKSIMSFSPINTRKSTLDYYLRVNSRTNLIDGCDESGNPTGTLYNEFLTAGDFFKIPVGSYYFKSYGHSSQSVTCSEIKYNYLYY